MITINSAITIGTLLVSTFTLVFSISNSKKTRRVTVLLTERQKRHDELFKHITAVLDIGRKIYNVENNSERQKMSYDLLNHKVQIWIHLNKENKYAKEMRGNCNEYIFYCAASLEEVNNEDRQQYLHVAGNYPKHIWVLIDKYIEEEEKLKIKFI